MLLIRNHKAYSAQILLHSKSKFIGLVDKNGIDNSRSQSNNKANQKQIRRSVRIYSSFRIDYLSNSAYNGIELGGDEMGVLDSFSVFNFSEGVPYVSITKNGVTFNKGVVMKLQYPEHVILLFNANSKQFALQCCDATVQNSVPFCSAEKRNSKVLSIRWNGKDLLNTISDIAGWNLMQDSYRIDGKLLPEEHAILFDLSKAVLLGDTSG